MGPNKDTESPNIGKMTRRFNRTAQWVKTLILAETELDVRVQVFKKLLAVLHVPKIPSPSKPNLNEIFVI